MEGTGAADQNGMDKSWQTLRKTREHYRMMELRTEYPYGLNNRYGAEYKTENTHINMWQRSFHHNLGNVTELIREVFIRVSVN